MTNKAMVFSDSSTVVGIYPKYAIINCKTSKTRNLKVFPKELVNLLKNWNWMEIRVMGPTTIFFFTDNKLALTGPGTEVYPRFDLKLLDNCYESWYLFITKNKTSLNESYEFDDIMKMIEIVRPDLKNNTNLVKTLLEFKGN